MMIQRLLENTIRQKEGTGKAIVIVGSRQVGKTTLLKQMFSERDDLLWYNGDEADIQQLFATLTSTRMQALASNKKTLIIDEAQRISDIGLKLKIIVDNIPELQVIVSGSSDFELANKINEPLTGRKWEYKMFPLSFKEMVDHHGVINEKRMLSHRLVYGYYPEIVSNPGNEFELLKQLTDSFLYKDILNWERIQKPDKLIQLLQALAFQVGSQISYNEIGQICSLDSKTVEKYIQLLEKTFIVFRLGSFKRNLRNELKTSKKVYFYDNGIRNALIANLNNIESRNDAGALWENFIISERIKHINYTNQWINYWFWRTKDQKEIDFIEESGGQITGYEFKFNPNSKGRVPASFKKAYPDSQVIIIHPQNFETFLGITE